MPTLPKNLPPDHNFFREELGARGKNHVFIDGEYVEKPYEHQEFPKAKYHKDYIHDKKAGVEYPYTAEAIIVQNKEEEAALGDEWKDSPAAFGIVTAPSSDYLAEQKRKKFLDAAKSAEPAKAAKK